MVTATVNSNTSFDTLRREDLFRNPPKDKSAFPALIASVRPHIDSFDALTEEGGLFDLARKDISVKTILGGKDGNNGNKISFRIDKIFVGKPLLSDRDKVTLKREIYPAEGTTCYISWKAQSPGGVQNQ